MINYLVCADEAWWGIQITVARMAMARRAACEGSELSLGAKAVRLDLKRRRCAGTLRKIDRACAPRS